MSSRLPDRVTMPLLELVTREAVDEDYVHVARRRAAGDGPPAPRRSGHRGAAVVTALFGLLVALAAVQTARNADVQEASREALVGRIDDRNAEVSSLEERIDAVREETAALRTTNARARGALGEATVQRRALQISTGFGVAVTGPGVRITVTDNPDGSADGRVRSSDLRLLVNGLWRAGAEAVAVNGRRLTALSAIVNANIAVQVNRVPLSPPYVVTAIGRDTLLGQLDASTSGARFQSLAAQFGFGVARQNEDEVLLPPAPETQLPLRWAESDAGLQDNGEETP